MEGINWTDEALRIAPVIIVLVFWGRHLLKNIDDLKEDKCKLEEEVKTTNKEYREISSNSLKVLVLVEDKLSELKTTNESVAKIYQMVERIKEIEEDRQRREKP